MVSLLKKVIFLFFPLALIALTFTNCDSSNALNVFAPEVEIDLDGNIVYNAVDPSSDQACLEIILPINVKPEDVQTELINNLQANLPQSTKNILSTNANLDINDLIVNYGSCPVDGRDSMPSNCSNKTIREIPVEHSYQVITYNVISTQANQGQANTISSFAIEFMCNLFPSNL